MKKNEMTQLIDGATKIFNNADSLWSEAVLLQQSGFLNRSVFLHQISMEECSKIETIGQHAVNYYLHGKIDYKKIRKTFTHEKNNYTNAYFLPVSEEEEKASSIIDYITGFKELQKKHHKEVNTIKNCSLYVNIVNANFQSPDDVVTGEILTKFKLLNERYLQIAQTNLKTLHRYINNPEGVKTKLKDMVQLFEKRPEFKNYSEHKAYMERIIKEIADRN